MKPISVIVCDRQRSEPTAPELAEGTRPRVLLVMASKSRSPLLEGLEALGIEIVRVHNCSQARQILEVCPDVRAVLTELTLPDGSWLSMADAVAANCVNTEVVVLARFVDARQQRHVLDTGIYDLLVEPFTPGEVARVVGGAVLTSHRRYVGISPPVSGPRPAASNTHAA